MADTTLLALFEDIDPAAEAIDKLHDMGVTDDRLNVISGIPVTHKMLGRPHPWTNVSRLALGGAIATRRALGQAQVELACCRRSAHVTFSGTHSEESHNQSAAQIRCDSHPERQAKSRNLVKNLTIHRPRVGRCAGNYVDRDARAHGPHVRESVADPAPGPDRRQGIAVGV